MPDLIQTEHVPNSRLARPHKKNIKITKTTKKIIKKPKQKTQNKITHSLNGNQVIKMITWNKGNAKFCNRINEIQEILDRYKPKILALQELNWTYDQDPIELRFQGFNTEMDGLLLTQRKI